MTPQWYIDAQGEMERGVREVKGALSNQRILDYQTAAGYNAKQDDVPWCGSFMAWLMRKNGIKYRFNTAAKAADWAEFGVALKVPTVGAVMVMPNHVCLFGGWVDEAKTVFYGLGGNQGGESAGGGEVRISKYSIAKVIAIRWPAEVPVPNVAKNPINNSVIKGIGGAVVAAGTAVAQNQDAVVAGIQTAQSKLSAGGILMTVAAAVIIIGLVYTVWASTQKIMQDKRFSNPATPKAIEKGLKKTQRLAMKESEDA